MGGIQIQPVERLELALDGVWTTSDAGLDPFDLVVPAGYLAANPNQAYDFSLTHLASDLEVSRLELGVNAVYQVTDRAWVTAGYRYLDYQDDAPYVTDTTGQADFYWLRLGWSF